MAAEAQWSDGRTLNAQLSLRYKPSNAEDDGVILLRSLSLSLTVYAGENEGG